MISQIMSQILGRPLIFMGLLVCSTGLMAEDAKPQVPFGNAVSKDVVNYHRHTPFIATSGKIKGDGLQELKKLGFKTILDLRGKSEGVADEKLAAEKLELVHLNIPVNKKGWPDQEELNRFKQLIENKDNRPLLVHCGSANRVGAMWAYYRITQGVSKEQAVEEGRTIGMRPKWEKRMLKNLAP